MKFYQACYGKPNNINWSLFNMSPDIPSPVKDFYERSENSNTPQNLNNEDMVDKNGNPLCLYELISQPGMIAVSKTMYGSKDNMGRAKMFSHGFIFTEENALNEPNDMLTISDENFKFEINETEKIPSELIRDERYSLEAAMQKCGMTENDLISLMGCVYISIVSATDFPMYIIAENKDEIMKPLMYCIYSMLPHALRNMLSFSNANNFSRAQFKTIMFVDKQYGNAYYYDVSSKKTNMDFSDMELHPERYPFLVKLKKLGVAAFSDYLNKLQTQLNKMDMMHTNEYDVLRCADTMLNGADVADEMNEQELTRFILELSAYAPMQNKPVDLFIAEILKKYYSGRPTPNDVLMRRLQVRAEKTTSVEYIDIYKQIQIDALLKNDADNIFNFLNSKKSISLDNFYEWCEYIKKTEDGISIIEKYYEKRIYFCNSIADVLNLYEESKKVIKFTNLYNKANEKCFEITKNNLLNSGSSRRRCVDIMDEYNDVYSKINQAKSRVEYIKSEQKLINEYWSEFDLSRFEYSDEFIENYRCMSDEQNENDKYKAAALLMSLYDYFGNSVLEGTTIDGMCEDIEGIVENITKHKKLYANEWVSIVGKVQKLILNKLSGQTNRNFVFWFKLAMLGYENTNRNPLKLMFKWNLPVLTDDESFRRSLSQRTRKYIPTLIKRIGGDKYSYGFIDDFDSKSEEYKIIKKRLSTLTGYDNDIAKQQKREQNAEKKVKKQQGVKLSSYRQTTGNVVKNTEDDDINDFSDVGADDDFDVQSAPKEETGFSIKKALPFKNFFGGKSKKQ